VRLRAINFTIVFRVREGLAKAVLAYGYCSAVRTEHNVTKYSVENGIGKIHIPQYITFAYLLDLLVLVYTFGSGVLCI
jgi:hypothetical protein